MPTYATPGIYVEEISTGAHPIEAVGTSTGGFVGVAPDAQARVNEAVEINNWSQFVRTFAPPGSATTPLAQAVYGFLLNGGNRCYVVNIGSSGGIAGNGRGRTGIDVLEERDEIAIVAAPGFSDAASYDALLTHCEKLKDRIAILESPLDVPSVDLLTKVATAPAGATPRKPKPEEAPGGSAAPEAPVAASVVSGLRPRSSEGGYGAFYFPHLIARDALSPNDMVAVSPVGYLAGVYARTDGTRGVHKAPANEAVRGAIDVTYRVTHEQQGELNQNGVNCIRYFPREGIRVWGARTLAPPGSEWRYVNVRRLFSMVEESIARSTSWIVFEPNDLPLWKAIRRDVSAFLTRLWRQGALMGQSPEEAFFVQCDAETNPLEVVDAGMVVAVIGIAPVKPAEFVVFRIGQGAGGAQVELQGTPQEGS